MGAYADTYRRSLADADKFWLGAASDVSWSQAPSSALDASSPPMYRWFVDAELNTCYNALDRHVAAGRGEQIALVYDSPVTQTVARLSYAALTAQVALFAGVLVDLGIAAGDRVVIYMPMIPEAVVAMLACARIGAIHSVVFGGFAAQELAYRIDDARPKVIVSASCGIEPNRIIEYKPLLDRALSLCAQPPERCVIVQRKQAPATLGPLDVDWHTAIHDAQPVDCVPVASTDPLYVLYTSGTTGRPKGVVRDNGGHAVALTWSMKNIYGAGVGDVFWAASDIGWVVGHSYIVYGPLFAGCTTILYEGKPVGTPDAGAFWRVIDGHKVSVLFAAPTALRAIKKEDPDGALLARSSRGTLKRFYAAGERLDTQTYEWATQMLGVPVIDHWWQTETGWPVAASPIGIEVLPIKPGSPSVPVPGYDVRILDEQGTPVPAGTEGAIAIRLPLPPGTLPTLWNDDERYISSYLTTYPGYYLTGDGGYIDADGYLFVMGRTDDVINVAGHRLSTGGMEELVSKHPAVAECAVVAVADEIKGELPVGFVVLKRGFESTDPAELERDLVTTIRDHIGAVACFRTVYVVPALPKTRSGKILRRNIRGIAEGRDVAVPSTIEDPVVLDLLRAVIVGGTAGHMRDVSH